MLRHRFILPLFLMLFLLLLWADRRYEVPLPVYFLLVLIFLGLETYGAANIRSGFHIRAHSQGDEKTKEVAITFDDGPHKQTEKILDILKKEQIPATFFCIGKKIEGHEHILRRINEEGHLLGNHSFSHDFWIDLYPAKKIREQIEKTNALIKSVSGKSPLFFRPPYGVTTPALARACRQTSMQVIGWNLRSFDTSAPNPEVVMSRIKSRVKPGSIILLHDHVASAELLLTQTIQFLKQNNYQVVGLDKLIKQSAYA